LDEITKGREKQEKFWCKKCRMKGHHKEKLPTFAQYLAIGALNPLPGGGYCKICKKCSHHPTKCPLLQKLQNKFFGVLWYFWRNGNLVG